MPYPEIVMRFDSGNGCRVKVSMTHGRQSASLGVRRPREIMYNLYRSGNDCIQGPLTVQRQRISIYNARKTVWPIRNPANNLQANMSHLKQYSYPGFGVDRAAKLHFSTAIRVVDTIQCAGQGGSVSLHLPRTSSAD